MSPTSGSRAVARTSVALGALAVLAVPAGVVAAQSLKGVTLLRSLYVSAPAAIVLALVAVVTARYARVAAQRTVFAERRGPVRIARFLAWFGMYVGVTAALAIAVYWILRARH
jgi:hypothetical protein